MSETSNPHSPQASHYRYDPDLMDNSANPFKALRLSSGQSQAEVARGAGVGTLHVLRAEQGLHSAPPDALLRYFTSAGVERRALAHQYDDWVRHMRAKRRLSRFTPFSGDFHWQDVLAVSAIVAPTSRPSQHAVSKLLLLQPSLLRRYLHAQTPTPTESRMGRAAVEAALAECGAVGRLVS